jgi:aryl carrier-like protein
VVGAEDDLLALGADSIHIFQIAARASRAGIAIAAKDMLRHRTIAAVVGMLDRASPERSARESAGGLPKLSQFRRVEHRS